MYGVDPHVGPFMINDNKECASNADYSCRLGWCKSSRTEVLYF